MRLSLRIAIFVGVLALALPAAAPATQQTAPGNGHKPAGAGESKAPDYSPEPPVVGPEASPPAQAKAYGHYCQGESKKHVPGIAGTPFSACVTAHAKAALHKQMSPGRACKATTGRHLVKGEVGTPHSRCVAGVVKQRREEREATS